MLHETIFDASCKQFLTIAPRLIRSEIVSIATVYSAEIFQRTVSLSFFIS
jgi:hypothetical protein